MKTGVAFLSNYGTKLPDFPPEPHVNPPPPPPSLPSPLHVRYRALNPPSDSEKHTTPALPSCLVELSASFSATSTTPYPPPEPAPDSSWDVDIDALLRNSEILSALSEAYHSQPLPPGPPSGEIDSLGIVDDDKGDRNAPLPFVNELSSKIDVGNIISATGEESQPVCGQR